MRMIPSAFRAPMSQADHPEGELVIVAVGLVEQLHRCVQVPAYGNLRHVLRGHPRLATRIGLVRPVCRLGNRELVARRGRQLLN